MQGKSRSPGRRCDLPQGHSTQVGRGRSRWDSCHTCHRSRVQAAGPERDSCSASPAKLTHKEEAVEPDMPGIDCQLHCL